MKNRIFNVVTLILMLLAAVVCLKGNEITHSSGIGDHLMTLYEYPVPLPISLQGKKVTRISYDGDSYYTDDGIKFVVHQNGIKLKLESVEYRSFSDDDWGFVTLGTLFTFNPKKGKVYSFNGVLPEGVPAQRLTVEYKGKKIKYYLHYGLRIVMTDGGDGPEPEDVEVVEFYSGDKGYE